MSDFDGVGWDETKPEREGPNRETAPKQKLYLLKSTSLKQATGR